METVTNPEVRQMLSGQLRTAVRFQMALWDACSHIDAMFGFDCNAVERVIEVTPKYLAKELDDRDLDSILGGLVEVNPSVPIGHGMKMQVPELDKEARRTLLKLFQNAISLLSDLWITASSIAETLGCPMERVVDKILWCSIAADIGPELGETNLRALLGELEAKGVDVLPGTLEA